MTGAGELDDQVANRLIAAHRDYESQVASVYDEVLHEVVARVEASGSLSKADIGALSFWKRLRADTPPVRKLLSLSDSHVREVTAAAVLAVNDSSVSLAEAARQGRAKLAALPCFANGDAFASALLVAAAPRRMAVYDRRADAGLVKLMGHGPAAKPGRYARYMETIEQLTIAVNRTAPPSEWVARDVDLALYTLGRGDN